MSIPIPTSGLLTYLDFLDPTCFTNGGTAVNDLSAANNDWTFGSTSYTYNSVNGAIDIAIGNYLGCNNLNILSGTNVPFTISFWFMPTVVVPSLYIFYNGGYPSNWTEIDTRDNSFVRLIANGAQIDTPANSITLNEYNNITLTFDGTNCKLYVNNVLHYNGSANFNFIQSDSYPAFDFAQRYTGTGTPGFALAAIYNRAISATECNDIYTYGYNRFYAPPTPPPLSSPGPVGGRRFGGRFNG
jgi:hypothetical protein